MRENRVKEIHHEYNSISETERDITYRNGQAQIDAVLATPSIINYVNRSKIIYFNKVIMTDHQGFCSMLMLRNICLDVRIIIYG